MELNQLLKLLENIVVGRGSAKLDILSDLVIETDKERGLSVLTDLKESPELDFSMLLDLTCIDWMDRQESRFEIVYHLLSLKNLARVRIKIPVKEQSPSIFSVVPLWSSANFLEREVWDMYGIEFRGHPDLRRILMYEEFKGHPLRKDYPLQGKQPRVPLRYPEVSNTARDMNRAPLVAIGRRS